MHERTPCSILAAIIIACVCLVPGRARCGEPRSGTPGSSKLVGTWKLVSIEERNAEGRLVTPLDYGPEPIGMLMYDAAGHMSVHAMRQGRRKLASDDVHLAAPDQAKAAFVGYGAYFGTYTVDERAGLVIHHVQGSLIPNWEGSEQRRRFTISGDKLILEPPEIPGRRREAHPPVDLAAPAMNRVAYNGRDRQEHQRPVAAANLGGRYTMAWDDVTARVPRICRARAAAAAFCMTIAVAVPSAIGQTKLFDTPLRDPSICRGPDGTYYLTGTSEPFWGFNNENGIRVWKSKDLADGNRSAPSGATARSPGTKSI